MQYFFRNNFIYIYYKSVYFILFIFNIYCNYVYLFIFVTIIYNIYIYIFVTNIYNIYIYIKNSNIYLKINKYM